MFVRETSHASSNSTKFRLGSASRFAAVFLDQLMLVTALGRALGAFDIEHVQLAFDVAKDEIGPRSTRPDPPANHAQGAV